MGAACACGASPKKGMKSVPGLEDEFKAAGPFVNGFERVHVQFFNNIETVWKVKSKSDGKFYSLHEKDKAYLSKNGNIENASLAAKEMSIMTQLDGSFLTKLIYACHDERFLYAFTDHIQTRLINEIELGRKFGEDEMKYIAASIVLGLEDMHSKKIMHRGIKPHNITFNEDGRVKVTGFLLSRVVEPGNKTDNKGALGYTAPEILQRQDHGCEVDWYCLGITLYEAAAERVLFDHESDNEEEANKKILQNMQQLDGTEIPQHLVPNYSPEFFRFLHDLLRINPKERLGSKGIEQVKKHDWFSGINWKGMRDGTIKSPYKPGKEEKREKPKRTEQPDADMLKSAYFQKLFVGYQFGLPKGEAAKKEELKPRDTIQNIV